MSRLLPLLASLAALTACSPSEPPAPAVTRIVLISIDTLRGDAFNPEWMPETWRFAQQGAVFERFFAASNVTQPTHASLLTGRHPWQHGLVLNGDSLSGSATTLPEVLQRRGYSTSGVVASFMIDQRFGFAQGFDRFEAPLDQGLLGGRQKWAPHLRGQHYYALASAVSDRALAQIRSARDLEQFFWFHYFDPHPPYGKHTPPSLELTEILDLARAGAPGVETEIARARDLYRDDVRELDRQLGRLFAALAVSGPGTETHVFLTADHGESFGEAAALGHGYRLSEAELRVPTFAVSPRFAAGSRRDAAGTVDLHATVLAAAGMPPGGSEGRVLFAPPAAADAAGVLAFGMRNAWPPGTPEVRSDGRVVGITGRRYFAASDDELWVGSAQRLAAPVRAEPQLTRQVQRRFAEFEAALGGDRTPRTELDAETERGLRALGYVQ